MSIGLAPVERVRAVFEAPVPLDGQRMQRREEAPEVGRGLVRIVSVTGAPAPQPVTIQSQRPSVGSGTSIVLAVRD